MKIFQGKVVNSQIKVYGLTDYLINLENANILITVENLTDIRTFQNQYFLLIDDLVIYTGYKKYELHNMFKKECLSKLTDVNSTTKLTLEQWPIFIANVRSYIYTTLDVLI